MLKGLRNLLGREAAPEKMRADDASLSVAALLVEAARADEAYSDKERAMIDAALVQSFGVAADAASSLRREAETKQAAATDIQRFTKVAKTLPAAQKSALLESLWRIVLSDGARDSWEDTLMRRICGLLYVSDVESGLARQRVKASLNKP